jgi:hypothetical protein
MAASKTRSRPSPTPRAGRRARALGRDPGRRRAGLRRGAGRDERHRGGARRPGVIDAITAWENRALTFDVTREAAGVEEGSLVGFEIDLFAGAGLFGSSSPSTRTAPSRTASCSRATRSSATTSNVTNATRLAAILGLTLEEQLAARHARGRPCDRARAPEPREQLRHRSRSHERDADRPERSLLGADPVADLGPGRGDVVPAVRPRPRGVRRSSSPPRTTMSAGATRSIPCSRIVLLLGVASCAALARRRRST